MTADPKPARRIVDEPLMRELVAAGATGHFPCIVCGNRFTEPHHVRLKSQGGDDVEANIAFLCKGCHRLYHDQGVTSSVRFAMGRWLRSQKGTYARAYLVEKLGKSAAAAYMHRQFGVRP